MDDGRADVSTDTLPSTASASDWVSQSQSSWLTGPAAHRAPDTWSDHTNPDPVIVTACRSARPSAGLTVMVGGGARGASAAKSRGVEATIVSLSADTANTHAPATRQSTVSPLLHPMGDTASTRKVKVAVPWSSAVP